MIHFAPSAVVCRRLQSLRFQIEHGHFVNRCAGNIAPPPLVLGAVHSGEGGGRYTMDWPLIVLLCGFFGFGVLAAAAATIKYVISYHKQLEYDRKHTRGFVRRKPMDLSALGMAKRLVVAIEFVVWFAGKKVLHRVMSRVMVGGPRVWLWAMSRFVFLPCFVLHLVVAILLLASVEDRPLHYYNPFIAGPAAFFLFSAAVDLALYATVRKPKVLVQMRVFQQAIVISMLWNIAGAALMRTGIVLDPLARLHCLETKNSNLYSLYLVLRRIYTDFGATPSCLAAECGVGTAVRMGGTKAVAPLFTACLMCSQPMGEVLRALGSAGMLAEHPSANPTGNITANGTQLCAWMDLPRPVCISTTATLNATRSAGAAAIRLESSPMNPCAAVAGCLSCVDSVLARVPILYVVHFCVLLVAVVATLDMVELLKEAMPETAVERTTRFEKEMEAEHAREEEQAALDAADALEMLQLAAPTKKKKSHRKHPKEPARQAWA